jgi:hypothetical protein
MFEISNRSFASSGQSLRWYGAKPKRGGRGPAGRRGKRRVPTASSSATCLQACLRNAARPSVKHDEPGTTAAGTHPAPRYKSGASAWCHRGELPVSFSPAFAAQVANAWLPPMPGTRAQSRRRARFDASPVVHFGVPAHTTISAMCSGEHTFGLQRKPLVTGNPLSACQRTHITHGIQSRVVKVLACCTIASVLHPTLVVHSGRKRKRGHGRLRVFAHRWALAVFGVGG